MTEYMKNKLIFAVFFKNKNFDFFKKFRKLDNIDIYFFLFIDKPLTTDEVFKLDEIRYKKKFFFDFIERKFENDTDNLNLIIAKSLRIDCDYVFILYDSESLSPKLYKHLNQIYFLNKKIDYFYVNKKILVKDNLTPVEIIELGPTLKKKKDYYILDINSIYELRIYRTGVKWKNNVPIDGKTYTFIKPEKKYYIESVIDKANLKKFNIVKENERL